MRFTRRESERAEGVLNGPDGTVKFVYDRRAGCLHLPDRDIYLDDYGWEVDEQGRIVFQSRRSN